jgi:5-formyltetrahydrofolate cyclo-ligase
MDKAELREQMRRAGSISESGSTAICDGLFAWLSSRLPGTISAYLAMEGEAGLESLFSRLPGWRWVLPRVGPDGAMSFRDAAVPVETHRFGMRQPIDSGPTVAVVEIDVFLVPGLAFDAHGNRLGNGGGHYDRALAEATSGAETVGIVPRSRLIESVPVEPHDRPVRWLATENGVIRSNPTP